MAETEWSKKFPTAEGDYLCRINEHDLSPVSFRLENGAIYEYGCGKNLRSDYYRHAADHEFLGPFTWRDFEQLLQLRRIAEQVMIALNATVVDEPKSANGLAFQQHEHFDIQLRSLRDAANALREALAQRRTGE